MERRNLFLTLAGLLAAPFAVAQVATSGKCSTCRYFNRRESACHRFPPHVSTAQESPGTNPFSPVKPNDWCGEYKR